MWSESLSSPQPGPVPKPRYFDYRVQGVLGIIASCYPDPKLNLPGVAARLLVSTSRLGHLLKQDTGLSFLRHLHSTRTIEAALLLKSTHLSVKEVATMVGYRSSTALDRHFKASFGCTPMDFKAQHKGMALSGEEQP